MFIDSHAHIEMPDFDSDREAVIERAQNAGIEIILNIGSAEPAPQAIESASTTTSLERAVALAEKHDLIYTTVGVHPHEAKFVTEELYQKLELACLHAKVIAWGEIGLDYHYDHSPRDVQREVFRRQLRLARKVALPVIVHSRAAEEDTLTILREEWSDGRLHGIMHCFSGSRELAQACIQMGFLIAFSGIITFKNAADLREVARELPLDKILIETDSPYLAPVPYRGRRNEPAFVVEVAKCIAQAKGVATEDVARRTTFNFKWLFKFAQEKQGDVYAYRTRTPKPSGG